MSVDEAKAILAVSPKKAEAAATTNTFKEVMDNSDHPKVGADGNPAAGDNAAESGASSILSAARAAGVIGFQKPDAKH
jgi:hypothetical protein